MPHPLKSQQLCQTETTLRPNGPRRLVGLFSDGAGSRVWEVELTK